MATVEIEAVRDASVRIQQQQLEAAQAQANRFADTAALFQSLGGGWWNRGDVTPLGTAQAETSGK